MYEEVATLDDSDTPELVVPVGTSELTLPDDSDIPELVVVARDELLEKKVKLLEMLSLGVGVTTVVSVLKEVMVIVVTSVKELVIE